MKGFRLMWRIYLEQGGRDLYTGLPLDIREWIWNTFVVSTTKMMENLVKNSLNRENDDNFTLINSNINQKKVYDSMEKFFERGS